MGVESIIIRDYEHGIFSFIIRNDVEHFFLIFLLVRTKCKHFPGEYGEQIIHRPNFICVNHLHLWSLLCLWMSLDTKTIGQTNKHMKWKCHPLELLIANKCFHIIFNQTPTTPTRASFLKMVGMANFICKIQNKTEINRLWLLLIHLELKRDH